MGKIIEGIFSEPSNIIALASLTISIVAMLVTVIYNAISHKHYIESLNPLLSFKLIAHNGFLYLTITNTGRSLANNIKVIVKELCNNGDRNKLELDDLFNNEFVLYPNEIVQGIIGISGENISQTIFPYIKVDITYIKGNDKKTEKYCRTITFSRTYENSISLNRLEDNLNSIAYSNNRIANYVEGRTLNICDRINVLPRNSLYKDMKDAFNNVERDDEKYESKANEISNKSK